MTCLAGLDISVADFAGLSTATEAQPLQPKLFLAKSPGTPDLADDPGSQGHGGPVQFHRELWRSRDIPDPAVSRHEDTITAELGAIAFRAEQLVHLAPESPMASARLASALLNAGRTDEAAEAATRVTALPLTDLPAALVAAQVLLQTGQRDAAEAFLLSKSQTDPASEPASGTELAFRCFAAALAADRGDHNLALLRLEDVIGAHAHALRGYLLLELAQTERALHELRLARNASHVQTPALLSNMAYAYAVLGSPNKAIRAARQALVVSPGNRLVLRHLAGYLISAGRSAEAASTLRRVAGPQDDLPPDLATALASALLQAGDLKRALRVLRDTAHRARFNRLDPVECAELQANAAVLEHRLKRISRTRLLEAIRKQRDLAGGRSISIACALADVISNRAGRAGRAEVIAAYEHLRTTYSEKDLLPLRARLANMTGDLDEQLRLVREWVRVVPLDLDALTSEVYLLCEVQDYGTAASAGLGWLRRFPHAIMLRNNTAYALALSGDVRRASAVLKPIADVNTYTKATAGLILLRKGRIQEGLELYKRAADAVRDEVIDEEDAYQQIAHLAFHLRLILVELDLTEHPLVRRNLVTAAKLNPEWLDTPTFMALARRAKRLSVAWPPPSPLS